MTLIVNILYLGPTTTEINSVHRMSQYLLVLRGKKRQKMVKYPLGPIWDARQITQRYCAAPDHSTFTPWPSVLKEDIHVRLALSVNKTHVILIIENTLITLYCVLNDMPNIIWNKDYTYCILTITSKLHKVITIYIFKYNSFKGI